MVKTLGKSLIAGLLAHIARGIIRKYRPTIVMITGSVGKTSTKDAVAAALSEKFYLRASEKSYNSEFGVPLTIIGAKNPWTSPHKWLRVIEEGLALLLLPSHYPKLLVLEVGADRPGDIARILKIATPDAVVVTRLPDVPVHVEAYASPKAVREEEFLPARALGPHGVLVICADDAHAVEMAKELPVHMLSFGFAKNADIRLSASDIFEGNGQAVGMQASLSTPEGKTELKVPGALGRPQLLAPAAAIALARLLGLSNSEAMKGLESYVPPPGRCRVFSGLHEALIIDDSYNASPAAAEEAMNVLALVSAKRRIAVVGDMLELGRYSVEEHARVGRLAAGKVDIVIAVGIRARALALAARESGMSEEYARMYDTAQEAAVFLKELAAPGDAILIKGSQSMRMERITQVLLVDSADLSKLVRQEKEWKKR